MPGVLIEACVASATDAIHAEEVGADRIELNQDLSRDGLTPAVGEVQAALSGLTVPLVVMVRPHDQRLRVFRRRAWDVGRRCARVRRTWGARGCSWSSDFRTSNRSSGDPTVGRCRGWDRSGCFTVRSTKS